MAGYYEDKILQAILSASKQAAAIRAETGYWPVLDHPQVDVREALPHVENYGGAT